MEKHIKNVHLGHASPIQTRFVHTDAASFKELVQKLTGNNVSAGDGLNNKATVAVTTSSPRNRSISPKNIQPSNGHGYPEVTRVRHSLFKTQERKYNQKKPKRQLELGSALLLNGSPSSRSSTPAAGSPVTPLRYEASGNSSPAGATTDESSPSTSEEKGLTDNWLLCFLQPSPTQSKPPTLLTLFPLTSPAHQP